MATIKDIASQTGLGFATISKFLNGGTVRPENAVAIKKAIESLGYTPNNTARALKTNKTRMIGIVIPELSNLFMTTILTEVEDILRQNGYGAIVTDCRSDVNLEKQSIEFLLSKQVDGIINMPISTSGDHLVAASRKGVPVVLVDRYIPVENVDFIGVDNMLAGELATDLLIKSGHKNIAIISGPKTLSTAKERVDGYLRSHELHGVSPRADNIVHADFTIESGYQNMKALLNSSNRATAVFTTNYEITVGAIIALNELGVKIPQELSVVGFDNIELSRVINPKLTIVAQPITEIAIKTAQIMLERLKTDSEKQKILLKPYIEHGKTIAEI